MSRKYKNFRFFSLLVLKRWVNLHTYRKQRTYDMQYEHRVTRPEKNIKRFWCFTRNKSGCLSKVEIRIIKATGISALVYGQEIWSRGSTKIRRRSPLLKTRYIEAYLSSPGMLEMQTSEKT